MSTTTETDITLDEQSQHFVASQVSSGRFGSASDVVRAGLRLLEQSEKREAKRAALRAAVEEGERSPVAEGFSLERALTRLRNTPRR